MTKNQRRIRRLIEQEVKSLIKEKNVKGKVKSSSPTIYDILQADPDYEVEIPSSLMRKGEAFITVFTQDFGTVDDSSSLAKVMGYDFPKNFQLSSTAKLAELVVALAANGYNPKDFISVIPKGTPGSSKIDEQKKRSIVLREQGEVAQSCSADADCKSGFECIDGYCTSKSVRFGRPGGLPQLGMASGTCSDGQKSFDAPKSRFNGFDFLNSRCWDSDASLEKALKKSLGNVTYETVNDFIDRQSDDRTADIAPLTAVNAVLAPETNSIESLAPREGADPKMFDAYKKFLKYVKGKVQKGEIGLATVNPGTEGYYPDASEEVVKGDVSDETSSLSVDAQRTLDTTVRGTVNFLNNWMAAITFQSAGFSDEGIMSSESFSDIEKRVAKDGKECEKNEDCGTGLSCRGAIKDKEGNVTEKGKCGEAGFFTRETASKTGRTLKAFLFTWLGTSLLPVHQRARQALRQKSMVLGAPVGQIGGRLFADLPIGVYQRLAPGFADGAVASFRAVAQVFGFVVGNTFQATRSGALNRTGVVESDARIGLIESVSYVNDVIQHIVRPVRETGVSPSVGTGVGRTVDDQWDILEQLIDEHAYTAASRRAGSSELDTGGMGYGVTTKSGPAGRGDKETVNQISLLDVNIPSRNIVKYIEARRPDLNADEIARIKSFFDVQSTSLERAGTLNVDAPLGKEFVTLRQLIDASRAGGSQLNGVLTQQDVLSVFGFLMSMPRIQRRVKYIHQAALTGEAAVRLIKINAYVSAYQGSIQGSVGVKTFLENMLVLARWDQFYSTFKTHRPSDAIETAREMFIKYEGLDPSLYAIRDESRRRSPFQNSFDASVEVAFGPKATGGIFDFDMSKIEIPGYTFRKTGIADTPANREKLLTPEQLESITPMRLFQDIISPKGKRLSEWLMNREIKAFLRDGGRSAQFADSYWDSFFSMGWLLEGTRTAGFRFKGPAAEAYRGRRSVASSARGGESQGGDVPNVFDPGPRGDAIPSITARGSTQTLYSARAQRSFNRRTAALRGPRRALEVSREMHRGSIEVELMQSAHVVTDFVQIIKAVRKGLGIADETVFLISRDWQANLTTGNITRILDDNGLGYMIERYQLGDPRTFDKIAQIELTLRQFADSNITARSAAGTEDQPASYVAMDEVANATRAAIEKYLLVLDRNVRQDIIERAAVPNANTWLNNLTPEEQLIVRNAIDSPNKTPLLHGTVPYRAERSGNLFEDVAAIDMGGPTAYKLLQASDLIAERLGFNGSAEAGRRFMQPYTVPQYFSPRIDVTPPTLTFDKKTRSLAFDADRYAKVIESLNNNVGGWHAQLAPGSATTRVVDSMGDNARNYANESFSGVYNDVSEFQWLKRLQRKQELLDVVPIHKIDMKTVSRMEDAKQIAARLEGAYGTRSVIFTRVYDVLTEYPPSQRTSGLPDVRENIPWITKLNQQQGPLLSPAQPPIKSYNELKDELGEAIKKSEGPFATESGAPFADEFIDSVYNFVLLYSERRSLRLKDTELVGSLDELFEAWRNTSDGKDVLDRILMRDVPPRPPGEINIPDLLSMPGTMGRGDVMGGLGVLANTRRIAELRESFNNVYTLVSDNADSYARASTQRIQQIERGAVKEIIPEGAPRGITVDDFGGYRLSGIPKGQGGRTRRAARTMAAAGGAAAAQIIKAVPRTAATAGKLGAAAYLTKEAYDLIEYLFDVTNINIDDFNKSSPFSETNKQAHDLVQITMLNGGTFPASLQQYNRRTGEVEYEEWMNTEIPLATRQSKYGDDLKKRFEASMKVFTYLRLINTTKFRSIKSQYPLIAQRGWGRDWMPQIEIKAYSLTDEEKQYNQEITKCLAGKINSGKPIAGCAEEVTKPRTVPVSEREECSANNTNPAKPGCKWYFRLPTQIKEKSHIVELGRFLADLTSSEQPDEMAGEQGFTRWFEFNDPQLFGRPEWAVDSALIADFTQKNSSNQIENDNRLLQVLGNSEYRRYIPSLFLALNKWQSIPKWQLNLYALVGGDDRFASCFSEVMGGGFEGRNRTCFKAMVEQLKYINDLEMEVGPITGEVGRQTGVDSFTTDDQREILLPNQDQFLQLDAAVEFLAIMFSIPRDEVNKAKRELLYQSSSNEGEKIQPPEPKEEAKEEAKEEEQTPPGPRPDPDPDPDPVNPRPRPDPVNPRPRPDPVNPRPRPDPDPVNPRPRPQTNRPAGAPCNQDGNCAYGLSCIDGKCASIDERKQRRNDELFNIIRESLIEMMKNPQTRQEIYKESLKINKNS